jgi:hypothetical protein
MFRGTRSSTPASRRAACSSIRAATKDAAHGGRRAGVSLVPTMPSPTGWLLFEPGGSMPNESKELTARDQFALAAMQGLLAAGKSADIEGWQRLLAQQSYRIAAAMMDARAEAAAGTAGADTIAT